MARDLDKYRAYQREYRRRWRKTRKLTLEARAKADASAERYRLANPEKARESARESQRRRRADPKIRAEERAKAHTAEYRLGRISRESLRRARKLGCGVSATSGEVREFMRSATVCAYCEVPFSGERRATLDHYIPLSRGGEHTLGNFRHACGPCNSSKHAMSPETFLNRRRMEIRA